MYALIDANHADYGVESICCVLEIAPSGYCRYRQQQTDATCRSALAQRDPTLLEEIRRVYRPHHEVYGGRKIWHQRQREGIAVPRRTVERLMRVAGLRGVVRGQRRITTRPDTAAPFAEDLVQRQFSAERPNQLWVADLTKWRNGAALSTWHWSSTCPRGASWAGARTRRCASISRSMHLSRRYTTASWPVYSWCTRIAGRWADSIGRRNTFNQVVFMGRPAGGMKQLTGPEAMRSSRAPSHRREVERQFLAQIATGTTSEKAAEAVGEWSAVGTRCIRQRRGMPLEMAKPACGRYLSFAEREEIGMLRAQNVWVQVIARRIGRSASTVSTELKRNAATRGGQLEYRASTAHWKSELVAKRPKPATLVTNPRLRGYVQQHLAGTIHDERGRVIAGPQQTPFIGRNKPHRGDRRWVNG